jgi:hypothetical protein
MVWYAEVRHYGADGVYTHSTWTSFIYFVPVFPGWVDFLLYAQGNPFYSLFTANATFNGYVQIREYIYNYGTRQWLAYDSDGPWCHTGQYPYTWNN